VSVAALEEMLAVALSLLDGAAARAADGGGKGQVGAPSRPSR